MEITIPLSGTKDYTLIIKRNWFTGSFEYFLDGQRHIIKSVLDVSTHLNPTLKNTYDFTTGTVDDHHIRIDHTRPLLFAGFRPHTWEFFVDGELQQSYKGY
jgi:hypothetical protein